jgi:glycosyltransferase involved in cell wall biosynthesis
MPEFIPWHIRQYYNYFFPRFVGKAYRIATVSEFSKQDISNRFSYSHERIDVVYNGANDDFKPVAENEQTIIREKFSKGCPYFLFIGLIHPRKNLTSLIAAFEGFKQSVNSNVKLLVVGSRKWWTDDMQQALESSYFKEDIIFTGRVTDYDLKRITASALALVYASHFEGFGIPILEAMYCDIPVITSAVSSLPEVGGNAVMYVNPSSVDSIKSAMLAMFCDSNMRKDLIEKAKIQREQFSWERTAGLLWDCIEKCLTVKD